MPPFHWTPIVALALAVACIPVAGGTLEPDAAPALTLTDCSTQPDGTACDDGNACTTGEICRAGRVRRRRPSPRPRALPSRPERRRRLSRRETGTGIPDSLQLRGRAEKHGTRFACVVAHGHDAVELDLGQLGDVFRALTRDLDAGLSHDLDRPGSARVHASAIWLLHEFPVQRNKTFNLATE